jgi:hypothetical protein
MSYASMAALAQDEEFQDRVKACAYVECQANLDDPDHPDWSNLAYDTLRGAPNVMDAFVRIVSQAPSVEDEAGDPPDQSLVEDDLIKAVVNDNYAVVASMWYNPNGTPWSGAVTTTPEPEPPEPEPPEPVEPSIIDFSPSGGPVTTIVNVIGTGLLNTTDITIGDPCGAVTVIDDSMVTGVVADTVADGSYDVVVTTGDTVLTAATQFEVGDTPPPPVTEPEVTGFTPTTGPQQTEITITGTVLSGTTAVTVSKPCSNVTVVGDTEVTATLGNFTPPQKGSFPVVVTVDGTDYTAPGQFTVT